MASGKVQTINSFNGQSVSYSLYHCTGTLSGKPSVAISTDGKLLFIGGGRIEISNFSRTGSNPGVSAQTSFHPPSPLEVCCGVRMDGSTIKPEYVYAVVFPDGTLQFQTSESHTNASGNPLVLIVNSCIIPIAL